MATGLYYSDACLKHDTDGHPESAQRLEAIMERLTGARELKGVSHRRPHAADLELVMSVHASAYVDRLVHLVKSGGGWLDPDTVVSPGSLEAALHAVGGTVQAAEAVATGKLDNAFVAVRPPGHHATIDQAMGFCLFNNVAIAARCLLDRGLAGRIAVVDFDVHHGNGTQEIFYEDPSVLYFSTHQVPLFPGSGRIGETGSGAGRGYTVNVPLPSGVGDEGYDSVLETVLEPAARRFRPDTFLVSAGYDAHWHDALAGMKVTVPGFRRIVARVRGLASDLCDARMVCVLEGGYDLQALAAGVETTMRVLVDSSLEVPDPYGSPPDALGKEAVFPSLEAARRVHSL